MRNLIKPFIYKLLGQKAYQWFYIQGKIKDIKKGRFNEPETVLFKAFVQSTDEVLDIGANFGYISVLLSSLATKGQIYAFEPIPFTYEVNRSILHSFKCRNVQLFQLGVGEKEEIKTFKIPTLDFGGPDTGLAFNGDRKFLEHQSYTFCEVKIVDLDTLLLSKLNRLSFIKIDIEGAEYFALKGMEKILQQFHPTIMIEICPDYVKGYGIDFSLFENYLLEHLGYCAFIFNKERNKLVFQQQLVDSNYILIHHTKVKAFSHLIE